LVASALDRQSRIDPDARQQVLYVLEQRLIDRVPLDRRAALVEMRRRDRAVGVKIAGEEADRRTASTCHDSLRDALGGGRLTIQTVLTQPVGSLTHVVVGRLGTARQRRDLEALSKALKNLLVGSREATVW